MAATVGRRKRTINPNQALVLSAIWGYLIIAGAVNGVFVLGRLHSHRAAGNPSTRPLFDPTGMGKYTTHRCETYREYFHSM